MDHIYSYKLLLSHALSQHKAFLLCLPKKCCRSRLKKGGSSSRLQPTKNRLRLRPKSGGSRRLRLRNTAYNQTKLKRIAEGWEAHLGQGKFKIKNISLFQCCGAGDDLLVSRSREPGSGSCWIFSDSKKEKSGSYNTVCKYEVSLINKDNMIQNNFYFL